MNVRFAASALIAALLALPGTHSAAQTVQDLQRQIDSLKAVVGGGPDQGEAGEEEDQTPSTAWYERIRVRGYSQIRFNEILSDDETAPAGQSRLRSPHDRSIGDGTSFFLRRVRLVFQGDVSDRISFYLQPDFATGVSGQSNGERRGNFLQLRDAYVDVFLDPERRVKLRLGQSKVPFGWENLQSSSNRLAFDRSDGVNSAVPGEREIGILAYFTPRSVQEVWDRLSADGERLFGNYGAFSYGILNGQGINREEQNDELMQVAMFTWPFELDELADVLEGRVLEVGVSLMRNRVHPEVRSGGVSADDFNDSRVGVHAILYPQPFGVFAEWTWGEGPEFDAESGMIEEENLNGGYVQAMYELPESPAGNFVPYAKWQRFRGGWKGGTNAPRLETDEVELGLEWQPLSALELTVAYTYAERREADERRLGRAEGSILRTQFQWRY